MNTPSPLDNSKQTKKRQRLSVVCQNCKRRKIKCGREKPSCTNCVKFGVLCNYNTLKWINNGDEDDEIKELDSPESEVEEAFVYKAPKRSTYSSPSNLKVKFRELCTSVLVKNKNRSDCNPLNPISIYKKDPYITLFIGYLILTLRINTMGILPSLKDNWITSHSNSVSKWMILLKIGQDDFESINQISQLVIDRQHLFKTNFFPFLTLQDSDDENIEFLTRNIEEVLPSKLMSEKLLKFFFQYIWPLRAFIDEAQFRETLSRIITYDEITMKPKISLTHRSDLANVSIFLIILRYASVAARVADIDGSNIQLITELNNSPVPISVITTAQLCLSFYKIARKTTMEIMQALLYLRCYLRDSPEDGDGLVLNQSQNLFGFIVQSSITMGLNRDPVNYTQTTRNDRLSNLRRRIWHAILEIDDRTATLSGSLSALPKKSSINVSFPLVESLDVLERVQRDDITKHAVIHELYEKISRVINSPETNLDELMMLIGKSKDYIATNHHLKDMNPLDTLDRESRHALAANFTNVKIFTKNLILLVLELQVNYLICSHSEVNSHLNTELYKSSFKNLLKCIRDVSDLCVSYLLKDFINYIDPAYNFEVIPLLNTALFRVFTTSTWCLLRISHAIDLLKSGVTESKNDLSALINLYDSLILSMTYVSDLMQSKLGQKYNTVLKIKSSYEFCLSALEAYKNQSIYQLAHALETPAIVDGYPPSDPSQTIKSQLDTEKGLTKVYNEWTALESDTTPIVNVNFTNILAQVPNDYILEAVEVLRSASTHCPHFWNLVPSTSQHQFNNQLLNTGIYDPTRGIKSLETLSMLESFSIDEENFGEIFKSLGLMNSSICHDFVRLF